jgi:hypothetical protein
MARGADFRGLTEIAGLSDSQLRALVLGNWDKLNTVLRARPSAAALRRLLKLEFFGRPDPRPYVLKRLRVALNRANNRDALAVLNEVLAIKAGDGTVDPDDLIRIFK